MRLVSVHVVHPYSIDTTTARKNSVIFYMSYIKQILEATLNETTAVQPLISKNGCFGLVWFGFMAYQPL